MNLSGLIFYLLAIEILITTALAVTRRQIVHAVLCLVMSFFGSAALFYLLGAPFLGALEILVYAGAIMILFLFIVMMLPVENPEGPLSLRSRWLPAAALGLSFSMLMGVLICAQDLGQTPMKAAMASPKELGTYLFRQHWLSIEIVSLLLLVALVGALLLGRRPTAGETPPAGPTEEGL